MTRPMDGTGRPPGFDAGTDWAELYRRQAARAGLLPHYAAALELGTGDRLLAIGSGPGYTALRLAPHVAPGAVYAVDRHRAAAAFCRDRAAEAGRSNVHPIVADATAPGLRFVDPIAALVAFVLHHATSPRAVLAGIAGAVPPGSPVLVVEYDPDADGAVGPPVEARLAPDRVTAWLTAAGFAVDDRHDLPEESYAVLARRADGRALGR